jgi:hypothetical protein
VRPVTRPNVTRANPSDAFVWVDEHKLDDTEREAIFQYLESNGSRILTLPLGGIVYDVRGQNVALIEAVKPSLDENAPVQLSLLENGRINYNKRYRGAILL